MKQMIRSTAMIAALTIIAPVYAELVIVVNPQSDTKSMTSSQAAQFFLGSSVQFTPLEQAKLKHLKN